MLHRGSTSLRLGDKLISDAQLIAVSGWVTITTKNNQSKRSLGLDEHSSVSKARPRLLLWCVSTPPIHFKGSIYDRNRFLNQSQAEVNAHGRRRMEDIWYHALLCFEAGGILCPVLCALGCDEAHVDPKVKSIPKEWANALARVLERRNWRFQIVIVSLAGPIRFRTKAGSCSRTTPITKPSRRASL